MDLQSRKFLRELGSQIRRARQARKWTQEDLARRCALHRTFIGSVERGERNISVLNLRHIARILRVSLPDLLSESL